MTVKLKQMIKSKIFVLLGSIEISITHYFTEVIHEVSFS